MKTMILNEVRTQLLNQGFNDEDYNHLLTMCNTQWTPGKDDETIDADDLKSALNPQSYRELSCKVVTTIAF